MSTKFHIKHVVRKICSCFYIRLATIVHTIRFYFRITLKILCFKNMSVWKSWTTWTTCSAQERQQNPINSKRVRGKFVFIHYGTYKCGDGGDGRRKRPHFHPKIRSCHFYMFKIEDFSVLVNFRNRFARFLQFYILFWSVLMPSLSQLHS